MAYYHGLPVQVLAAVKSFELYVNPVQTGLCMIGYVCMDYELHPEKRSVSTL